MNDLEKYFENNPGSLISKWQHYFKAYDRHFQRFRDTDVVIAEIGVCHGGSLQMWKHYFGSEASVIGIDINPRSLSFEEDQVKIIIGDQEDRSFLKSLKQQLSRIDILIDDGGHTMSQQINTFEELFPAVSDKGIYVCEDTHTSYWSSFGGGYRKPGTFIEYAKDKVDDINAFHNRQNSEGFDITAFTKSVKSMHFYDSMVVIEKEDREPPQSRHTGHQRLPRFRATRLPAGSSS